MEIPYKLREATERLSEGFNLDVLKKTSDEITRKYTLNRGEGARLVTSAEEAVVYSIVRMPATFCAVSEALNQAFAITGNNKIEKMLDIGSGTGAAAWAAAFTCAPEHTDCVEREREMISVARRLNAEEACPSVSYTQADIEHYTPEGSYDLVTASYALNEMTEEVRRRTLDKLWQHTDGLLLIIEPGTPAAFEVQRGIREYMAEKGANLIAPCPQGAQCALPQGDWCHFSCRVPRSRLHKLLKGGDAPYEDEKFTYSAFYKPPLSRTCKGRILRHPQIREKQITFTVCAGSAIEQRTLYKRDKEAYKKAKKLTTGDEFEF